MICKLRELLGVEEMGQQGLGARRRGAFRLDEVWAVNPLLGRQEAVYQRALGATVHTPALPIDADHVAEESGRLTRLGGDQRLQVQILTPTRLVVRASA